MTPAEQLRADKLLALARERFVPSLLPIEEQVILHSCQGEEPPDWTPDPEQEPAAGTTPFDPGSEPRCHGPYIAPGGRPLPGWPGPALDADFLRWLLTDPEATALFDPKGLRVSHARITRSLDLNHCSIPVRLRFGYCLFEEPVWLNSGENRGLHIFNSTLTSPLVANGTVIHGPAFLRGSEFSVLNLRGIHVEGPLELSGTRITSDIAGIFLDQSQIDGYVLLDNGFVSLGGIWINDAQIGRLDLRAAQLQAPGVVALSLYRTAIQGHALFRDGFVCEGDIRADGAHVAGNINCENSTIHSLSCEAATAERLFWINLVDPATSQLSLLGAHLDFVALDQASLTTTGKVLLNHLELKALTDPKGHALTAPQCITWLDRQPPEHRAEAQPWLQLSRLREAAGDHAGARRLIFELRLRQIAARWPADPFAAPTLLGARRLWNGTLRTLARLFARLEQNPFRILEPLAVLLLIGTSVFHLYRAHFAETSDSAYTATHTPGRHPSAAAYPRFSTFVYALEDTLPLVHLGQDAAWAPHTDPASRTQALYWVLVSLRWLLILSGWAMGSILAAALSARFRT